MTLVLSEWVRKPFVVKAIQVTLDNMSDVAKWCGGTVKQSDTSKDGGMEGSVFYIKVDVKRPLDDKQTRAYIGDYVLAAGRSFKVYTEYAFKKSFMPNTDTPKPTTTGNRPKKHRPRPQGPGPDLSPIGSSQGIHPAVSPNQMALVEVHDHGFPDEPMEMREQRAVITINQPFLSPEDAAQVVGLTPDEVQSVLNIYNK